MDNAPKIQTAIPKRRYNVGQYMISVLGEIQSTDPVEYRYLMAFVEEGSQEPVLYLSIEQLPPNQRDNGRYQLRVINSAMAEVMDTGDGWGDLDAFCEQGIALGMQALGLKEGELVSRLL